jgi:hypothetical protein
MVRFDAERSGLQIDEMRVVIKAASRASQSWLLRNSAFILPVPGTKTA